MNVPAGARQARDRAPVNGTLGARPLSFGSAGVIALVLIAVTRGRLGFEAATSSADPGVLTTAAPAA